MRDSGTAQTITIALWRKMLNRERGGVARTEKAMGVNPDTLRAARRNGGLRLRHVTDAIEAMGIPPSVFFNDIFGGVSTTAEERFMARGAELAACKLVELPEFADDIKPDRLTEDDFARLDAARFEDPCGAAEQAAGVARLAARDGRRGDAAAAVARQGSALRVAEIWEPAWVCVWWALKHVRDTASRADTLQRGGSIVSDFGDFQDAAELAQVAAIEYMECGNEPGLGRSLVSRGLFLRCGDKFSESVRALNAALAFLPSDDHPGHFAIHQNLGLANLGLGAFELAEYHASAAEAITGVPERMTLLVAWLRARLATALDDYPTAIRLYQAVVGSFEQSPGDAALATAELCRVYLLAARPSNAIAQGLRIARFAMPKSQNPIIAAAIMDLYRTAQSGALTLRVLQSAIAQIQHGLRRRAAVESRPAARNP